MSLRRILFFLFFSATCAAQAAAPRRVVSLMPSHTEIIVLLGAEQNLVAVGDAEDASVMPQLPRVASLPPNWEFLVAVRPDLILADVSHRRYEKDFRRFHLPAVYLPATQARSLEDVFELIREIGRRLERSGQAEAFVQKSEARLKALEARLPAGPGPRVYFEIWPRPLQACGPNTLQGHMLARARAVNVVPASRATMPLISLEWVPQTGPDVILHTGVVSSEEVAGRPGWSGVPAVRNRRVHAVDRNLFSRAGPRVVDAFERLIQLLCPQP